MRIGSTNSLNYNQNFRGWFTNLRIKRTIKKNIEHTKQENTCSIAERAENKLKERLVNFETLMIDFYTDKVLDMKTGKLFTGKYVVPADKLEHIYHIKDGEEVGAMVRLKTGQKQWVHRGEYDKDYNFTLNNVLSKEDAKNETIKMIEADNLAEERMRDNYVIKLAMESDDGTVYLTK